MGIARATRLGLWHARLLCVSITKKGPTFRQIESCQAMRVLPVIALCLISACMPYGGAKPNGPQGQGAQVSRSFTPDSAAGGTSAALPQDFAPMPQSMAVRSNTQLAETFLNLAFQMESGRVLPVLSRFEGPITVRLIGDVPASARAEMTRLIARFRNEAGIDIREVAADQIASINVDFQPRREMARVVPMAACFVVPRLTSFEQYKSQRNGPAVDWTTVTTRQNVAVFVPSDTSAQEVRDCLHEEVAQAMGPLNDMYHLPDTVFNDDNFHGTLTSFDMLVLRLYNAPQLQSGLNKQEVARRLPALLAQINPAGEGVSAPSLRVAPRSWVAAVEQSFGVGGTAGSRVQAAEQMLNIAMAQGWRDTRLGFSYYAKGRALAATAPQQAVQAFTEAARIYRAIPGTNVQLAHVNMQLAAIALATGQTSSAIQFADRAIPTAQAAENASLLATLMLIKAEALHNAGQKDAAAALRLDSLGWARYGFGADTNVRARQGEIATLGARGRKG